MDREVLNILRIAIYQMHFLDKVPEFAACNEAVELAKEFGSENSSRFVNGVLGTAYKQLGISEADNHGAKNTKSEPAKDKSVDAGQETGDK